MINKLALILLGSLFSFSAYSFTISGNTTNLKGEALAYVNVTVSQGDLEIKNVISNAEGYFKLQLEAGVYRLSFKYYGYISKENLVELNEDLILDIKMERDLELPEIIEVVEDDVDSDESSGAAYYSIVEFEASGEGYSHADSRKAVGVYKDIPPYIPSQDIPVAGKLTAGEINDFSKWDLWQDLKEGELSEFRQEWEFELGQRFAVQVMNASGLPVSDADVSLMIDGESVFQTKTDNTGKAELWSLHHGKNKNVKVNISKESEKQTIKEPVSIASGINSVQLETDCDASNMVDIAFVVDATGSMGDELEFLKAELNAVMFEASSFDDGVKYRFANVFYRDRGDEYITRTMQFTQLLSESANFIQKQFAAGGGDFEEAVDEALEEAVVNLTWSAEARARILFLVLDAPPHQDPESKERMLKASKMAAAKGIRIVPIVASGINKSAEYLLRNVALASNGTYLFLTDHSGVGHEHLEPSTDSYDVELLSDLLKKVIVRYSYRPNCENEVPDLPWDIDEDSIAVQVPHDGKDSTATIDTAVPFQIIKWNYYPNPTQGMVYIQASAPISELHLTDLNGKLLQRITDIHPEEQVKVDLSSYASGIYLIRFPVGNKWVSGKIILTR